MDYTFSVPSPLGGITLASDGSALTGLWFDGQKYFGQRLDEARMEKDLPVFDQAARWLEIYFSGGIPGFTPPLRLRGSAFALRVYDALLSIPYGQVTTYGHLAAKTGCASARAVGGAVGHNPISLIVPCHRVIGANGQLTGYAGGVERKIWLLQMEKALPHA